MRTLIAIFTSITLVLTPSHVRADDSDGTITASARSNRKAYFELYVQMQDTRTAPISYWDALAKCETKSNWKNQGQWAGGLGIYQRTWYEFGGRDYAKRPQDASRVAQIVIANRIALHGYQWKNRYLTWADKVAGRGMVKHPVRYFGWGCASESTGNPCGRLRDGSKGTYRPPRGWWRNNCS